MRVLWERLPAVWRGRLLVLLAAVLWSLSGTFTKGLADLPGGTKAVGRALAAGTVLLVICYWQRTNFTWNPKMIWMLVSFTAMNYTFLEAMQHTTVANAILLQYTATAWMFLASIWLLREPLERSSLFALIGAMIGLAVLLSGEWQSGNHLGLILGLLSGMAYAGVVVSMRVLRKHSALWLATLNHLCAGILLGLILALLASPDTTADPNESWWRWPTWPQAIFLALFGVVQMALPYVLFGLGLRTISPQEAGILTLLEPILNTWFTFLFHGEVPSNATMIGGIILLLSLALRYLIPMFLTAKEPQPSPKILETQTDT